MALQSPCEDFHIFHEEYQEKKAVKVNFSLGSFQVSELSSV